MVLVSTLKYNSGGVRGGKSGREGRGGGKGGSEERGGRDGERGNEERQMPGM